MLNSEPLPSWFDYKDSRGRGFITALIGKVMLIIWSVVNMILVFAFTSMMRAAMMKPVMESPVDTTQQLGKGTFKI